MTSYSAVGIITFTSLSFSSLLSIMFYPCICTYPHSLLFVSAKCYQPIPEMLLVLMFTYYLHFAHALISHYCVNSLEIKIIHGSRNCDLPRIRIFTNNVNAASTICTETYFTVFNASTAPRP